MPLSHSFARFVAPKGNASYIKLIVMHSVTLLFEKRVWVLFIKIYVAFTGVLSACGPIPHPLARWSEQR